MAKRRVDYASIKRLLDPYHNFSFRNTRNFSSQQKSAITRVYRKLLPFLKKINNEKISFIPYPKIKKRQLPDIDAFYTNKGIFYKFPGAKLKQLHTGELVVTIHYKKLREVFVPIPESIRGNMELVEIYIEGKQREYKPKPDYTRWSINGYAASTMWVGGTFLDNGLESASAVIDKSNEPLKQIFNGIFFGWNPGRRDIQWLGAKRK